MTSPIDEQEIEPHHQSFEQLLHAISQECFICSTLWQSLGLERRTRWIQDPARWQAMSYWIRCDDPHSGLIKLNILYLDCITETMTDIRFRFIPVKGSHSFHIYHNRINRLRRRDLDPQCSKHFEFTYLELETSSTSTLENAFRWYSSCRDHHERCKCLRRQPTWYPTRLIDIGVDDSPLWRLHLVSKSEETDLPYLTLSYRWGQNPHLKLLSSTFEEFCKGKLIQDLPRTFRDTVVVARKFGIRYIWIDSLCIIQDSMEDWIRESEYMQYIYSNCACNIAAAASIDPEGGLFRLGERIFWDR